MITSPENTPVLDEADTQKIELVKNRLEVLQDEVLTATKKVASLDEESVNKQKELDYIKEAIDLLNPQVDELIKARIDLDNQITAEKSILLTMQEEQRQILVTHQDKEKELVSRETSISAREVAHQKVHESLLNAVEAHNADVKHMQEVKKAFETAIATM
jgi:chromosome segregation ATPase